MTRYADTVKMDGTIAQLKNWYKTKASSSINHVFYQPLVARNVVRNSL